jgi:putative oxidoreductase
MSTGLLLLRLVVGALFVGHGTQKLFGWFGGHGLDATGDAFDGMGFRPGRSMAVLAGSTEAFGGLLVVLGLATPLAAAMLVGVMVTAGAAIHFPNGPWVTEGGYEYNLVLAVVAATLAFVGPGAASLDHAFGMERAGLWSGLFALVLGVGGGALAVATRAAELRRDAAMEDARTPAASAA